MNTGLQIQKEAADSKTWTEATAGTDTVTFEVQHVVDVNGTDEIGVLVKKDFADASDVHIESSSTAYSIYWVAP